MKIKPQEKNIAEVIKISIWAAGCVDLCFPILILFYDDGDKILEEKNYYCKKLLLKYPKYK